MAIKPSVFGSARKNPVRAAEKVFMIHRDRTQDRKQSPMACRSPEPNLAVPAEIFSDKTLLGLIDDWIVPALVEEFLRSKKPFTLGADGA